MRQTAADDLRDLAEHLTDVQRLGNRVQQTAQAVDAFPPRGFAFEDRGALKRQPQQVCHRVGDLLMLSGKRVVAARGEPEGAADGRALADRADDA